MPNDSHVSGTKHLEYLDFELEIDARSGHEYSVTVLHSPAGEARSTMRFPYDETELAKRLKDLQIAVLRSGSVFRQILSSEEQTVQDFGRELFEALLAGGVRTRYDVSLERARQESKGLRLKLRIEPPELARLPWEFLYDPHQAEYVCLSRNTPIVRYLELPQSIQPINVTPPLRILAMIASPNDLPPLNAGHEKRLMKRATKDLQTQGLVELTWLEGQTWRDLQRAMRRGPWHVFHFVGHGSFDRNRDEGLVALADEDGETKRLTATQLGRLLADHDSLHLALLNACEGARGGQGDIFSSTASILMRRGIPAVLAMQYDITDRAAIEFARAFYEALVDGLPVDAAVAEARKAINTGVANTLEWGTPVLYMRSPNGDLFSVEKQAVRGARQTKVPRNIVIAFIAGLIAVILIALAIPPVRNWLSAAIMLDRVNTPTPTAIFAEALAAAPSSTLSSTQAKATSTRTPTGTSAPTLSSAPTAATSISLVALTPTGTSTPTPEPSPSPSSTATDTPPPTTTYTPKPSRTPTSSPTATPTPHPTTETATIPALQSTETSVSQPGSLLPAPTLLGPEDGHEFEGSDAQITLEWSAVKDSLAENEFYLIAIDHKPKPSISNQEGEVVWTDYAWTKGTNWSANEHGYLLDNSADGLFSWSVTLLSGRTIDANGVPQGPAVSEASEKRTFVWVGIGPDDGNGPGEKPPPPP
jgi:hypothetical protein